MPTYTFRCAKCDRDYSAVMSIRQYIAAPPTFVCCGVAAERFFEVMPGFSGIANALAGDRHYDGLRAPDGTDISTRSKHREYMKRNNLTTADDFTQTWKRAAEERRETLAGNDKSRVNDVTDAVRKVTEGYKPILSEV